MTAPGGGEGGRKLRVAYLSHLDMNLYLFRLAWMKALVSEGHEVFAIAPGGRFLERFREHGVEPVEFSLRRESLNPFGELRAIYGLYKTLKAGRFDILHAFTIRPNFMGAVAGRLARVPAVITNVTGLGYIYTERTFKARLLRAVSALVYRIAFRLSTRVIFQNPDDLNALGGLLDKKKAVVIKGTGVDTGFFSPESVDERKVEALTDELGIKDGELVITIVARLLWNKGVGEFADAARELAKTHTNLRFLVVGWKDRANPSVVPEDFIEDAQTVSGLSFLGERDDVREILSLTDIYVLPSWREGTPRSVLEAMSMQRPVVAADVPGSRQTVLDGETGFLVPLRDARALAGAVKKLIDNKELRLKMGEAGRRLAIDEFSDEVVVEKIMALYGEVAGDGRP